MALMIEKTKNEFGYNPSLLSKGSTKKIIIKCDYCGIEKEVRNQSRNEGLKKYPKDSCKKCSPQKIKESLLEKYGVESTQSLPEVQAKTKATNLEKFGSEHFFSSNVGKDKIREVMIEKYGVDHNMKDENIRKNRDKTLQDKYGVDNIFKLESVQKNAIKKRIESGNIKTFNGKMVKDLASEHGYAYSSMIERINKLGLDIATFEKKQESSLELKMSNILDSIGIEYEKQFKVDNKVADFKIKDSNILIEADGLYWHSDASDKPIDYHVKKRELYKTNSYRPFFFREDEILKKSEIIKSIILNALGRSKRVYARKLIVKNIDFKESNNFIEKNHLMGKTNNVSHSFGLLDGTNILAILQIKKLNDGNYDISRFCTAYGINIVGGFSKLLQHFIRNYNPQSVQTFIDLRYGSGDYLNSLNFDKISQNISFKWTDGENTYHRLRFRGNSGYNHGLYKIWDCGQAKFIYKIS